jgi:hypothetical protein
MIDNVPPDSIIEIDNNSIPVTCDGIIVQLRISYRTCCSDRLAANGIIALTAQDVHKPQIKYDTVATF